MPNAGPHTFQIPTPWPSLDSLAPEWINPLTWAEHGGRVHDLGVIPLQVGSLHWHGALPAETWPHVAQALQRRLGMEIHPVLVPSVSLQRTLQALLPPDRQPASVAEELGPAPWPLAWPIGLAPKSLARHLLLTAVDLGASDLHLEVTPDRYRLAARRHGQLRPLPPLTTSNRRAVLDEIRSLAGITPLQQGLHAEGRLSLPHHGHRIDFRIQVQPAIEGDALTARVLDPRRLADLCRAERLPDHLRAAAAHFFAGTGGLFLIVGPTDSGKTTTLLTLLSLLDASTNRIITLETPVEYRLPGLLQIPCERNPDSHHQLADALVSSLRAAPDLIVCGEIRTAAEAQVVAEAALTGHRVLATLHAGDAPGALLRLRGLGLSPDLIAGIVSTLVVQRLGERPCAVCGGAETIPQGVASRIRQLGYAPPAQVLCANGCPACDQGVGGRAAIAIDVSPSNIANATPRWIDQVICSLSSFDLTAQSALSLLPAAK
jgi:general secretion pathway protein E